MERAREEQEKRRAKNPTPPPASEDKAEGISEQSSPAPQSEIDSFLGPDPSDEEQALVQKERAEALAKMKQKEVDKAIALLNKCRDQATQLLTEFGWMFDHPNYYYPNEYEAHTNNLERFRNLVAMKLREISKEDAKSEPWWIIGIALKSYAYAPWEAGLQERALRPDDN